MHIAEGYLPLLHCAAWGAATAPHLVFGARRLRDMRPEFGDAAPPRATVVAAIAFGLLLTSLKLPSVAGSSSHPTGLALGTLLLGPSAMAPVAFGILLLQALFLAHGGVSTIGANCWALGVVGPWVTWAVWHFARRWKISEAIGVALAAGLGDLATYLATSTQLALAYPDHAGGVMGAFVAFAGVFAITQVPIAIAEGALTAIAYRSLQGTRPVRLSACEAT